MTPQYILRKSLCREPHCADPKHYGGAEGLRRMQLAEIENLGWASEYAPGSGPGSAEEKPKRGVLYADWNYFPRGVDTLLERYGFAIEWSDTVSTCYGCDRLICTEPDSYSWRPEFVVTGSEILCTECAWENAGLEERIALCAARDVSIFAARRDEIPNEVRGQ